MAEKLRGWNHVGRSYLKNRVPSSQQFDGTSQQRKLWCLPRMLVVVGNMTTQVIQAVTFWFPSWRSPTTFEFGSRFHHPKKGHQQNCQDYNHLLIFLWDDESLAHLAHLLRFASWNLKTDLHDTSPYLGVWKWMWIAPPFFWVMWIWGTYITRKLWSSVFFLLLLSSSFFCFPVSFCGLLPHVVSEQVIIKNHTMIGIHPGSLTAGTYKSPIQERKMIDLPNLHEHHVPAVNLQNFVLPFWKSHHLSELNETMELFVLP